MSEHDLLTEVFPIQPDHIPRLAAYRMQGTLNPNLIGGKLAYRFQLTLPGRWAWADGVLLTDTPTSSTELMNTLTSLQSQMPDLYGPIESIDEAPRWQPSPVVVAQFIHHTSVRALDKKIQDALLKTGVHVKNGYVIRDYRVQAWHVANEPALSISVGSQLRYYQNIQQYLNHIDDPQAIIGLRIVDKTAPSMMGEVLALSGTMSEHRDRLMQLTRRSVMQDMLRKAPDDERIITIRCDNYEYQYAASALHILLPSHESDEWQRFDMDAARNHAVLNLAPDEQADVVRIISDLLKGEGIIDNAYNSRSHESLFMSIDFMPSFVFGDNKVFPLNYETMGDNFVKGGLYHLNNRFQKQPIKIAVINTLEDKIDDFIEALRRRMEREFGLQIDLIRERKVRVVNAKNLDSAVRKVEKDDPHVVLAFFETAQGEGDEANYGYLKSVTVGKGIASHAIFTRTMHDPDAMPLIIMGILAKTGSTPYALAEPLEYTDYVVGLAIVREQLTRGDRVTAIARIYHSSGEFVRYIIEQEEIDTNDPIPLIIMQKMFPNDLFEDKRVIVHHHGAFEIETLRTLAKWSFVLNAEMTPIEVISQHVPHLYGLAGGKVGQPPWGSMFRLNDTEAYIVSLTPQPDQQQTSQPLHVRIPEGSPIVIEQAVYSVLAWTLLHYGTPNVKLPVSIHHADNIMQWLGRGMIPTQTEGDIPFWL